MKKFRHTFCPPGSGLVFGAETFIWGLVEALHDFSGIFNTIIPVIIYICVLVFSYLVIILINSWLLYNKYSKSLENNGGLKRQVRKDENEIQSLIGKLQRNQRLIESLLDHIDFNTKQELINNLLIRDYIYGDDNDEEERIQDSKNN